MDAEGRKTGGRQKGTPNHSNLRKVLQEITMDQLKTLEEDLLALKPVDRVKAVIDLAKFCIPTLKAVEYSDNSESEQEVIKIVFSKKE